LTRQQIEFFVVFAVFLLVSCSDPKQNKKVDKNQMVSQNAQENKSLEPNVTGTENPANEKILIPDHLLDEEFSEEGLNGAVIANDTTAAYLTSRKAPGVTPESSLLHLKFKDREKAYDSEKSSYIGVTPNKSFDEAGVSKLAVFYITRDKDKKESIGMIPVSSLSLDGMELKVPFKGEGLYQLGKFIDPIEDDEIVKDSLRDSGVFWRSYLQKPKTGLVMINDANSNFGIPLADPSFGNFLKFVKYDGNFGLNFETSFNTGAREETIASLSDRLKNLSIEFVLDLELIAKTSRLLTIFGPNSEDTEKSLTVQLVPESIGYRISLASSSGKQIDFTNMFEFGKKYAISIVVDQKNNLVSLFIDGLNAGTQPISEGDSNEDIVSLLGKTPKMTLGMAENTDEMFRGRLQYLAFYDKALDGKAVESNGVRLFSYDDY
jgi:hypothetical protein